MSEDNIGTFKKIRAAICHNCPFCKHRAANAPKAHVVFVDETANPISFPAPRLLGVKKGDQVIVQGNAHWNVELNVLEVKSDGIYIIP